MLGFLYVRVGYEQPSDQVTMPCVVSKTTVRWPSNRIGHTDISRPDV